MAGSLVQTSTVEAGVTLEGGGGGRAQWNMPRFRYVAGALQIMCRLVLVSRTPRPYEDAGMLVAYNTPLHGV